MQNAILFFVCPLNIGFTALVPGFCNISCLVDTSFIFSLNDMQIAVDCLIGERYVNGIVIYLP